MMNKQKPEDTMTALARCWAWRTCGKDNCNEDRDCPYYNRTSKYSDCQKLLLEDIRFLLFKKDAEYRELWEERCRIYEDLQGWKAECKKYQDAWKEKDAEVDRLKCSVNRLKKYDEERDIRLHARLTETARTDAITEVLDKAIDEAVCKDNGDGTERLFISIEKLKKIAKEMKGEAR